MQNTVTGHAQIWASLFPFDDNVVSACLSLTGGKPAAYDFINVAPESDSVIILHRRRIQQVQNRVLVIDSIFSSVS